MDVQCLPDVAPPDIIPEAATFPWQGIPVGSKRLDIQPVFGENGEKVRLKVTYGIYFSPAEFIQKASQLSHPFDVPLQSDAANKDAIAFILQEGPAKVAAHRAKMLSYYIALAKKLSVEEEALHQSLNPDIRPVLASKRLLLFKEMMKDAEVEDSELFNDLCNGF